MVYFMQLSIIISKPPHNYTKAVFTNLPQVLLAGSQRVKIAGQNAAAMLQYCSWQA